jgi:predicted Zn-dependent protease
VVPAYQKQLPVDNPTKIKFAFYVVDEPHYRFALSCNLGVILVPRQVIMRLKNDDQLAAVLADGVAFNLQRQSYQVNRECLVLYGTALAADASLFLFPEVFPVAIAGEIVAEKKILLQMEEQRGRIALSLLADAGYDPWQAPEAWKLLEPKKLPDDLSTLKFPSRSEYQLGILSMQYSKENNVGGATSTALVAPNQ